MPAKSKTRTVLTRHGKRTASRNVPIAARTTRKARFPVVGIGASAGGLAACSELLGALPARTGMAFVIISHMDPDQHSMLDVLLAKKSKMPVLGVSNGTAVQADHVYVIQPNSDVTLRRGLLHTSARRKFGAPPTVIDRFFASLAQERGAYARAVVLSGVGSDGTAGLKRIHECGGVTLAQEPVSAQFDGMPNSAIQSGCVDFVLSPKRIAAQLLRSGGGPAAKKASETGQDHLNNILASLFQSSGVDFQHYKLGTLQRRIARRMQLKRIGSLAAYARYLREHADEAQALYRDSLIHVTSFFRDEAAFRALQRSVLAPLTKALRGNEPIRVWVPGCARGQEVYSIGMLLLELLGERAPRRRIQLFGTDISNADILAARAGRYKVAELASVSPARRARFFVKRDDEYQVSSELRELCVFSCHDVGNDPPFSRLDLVSCRNLLIYFSRPLQDRVIQTFHYALKPEGHLFLGSSEALSGHTRWFTLMDKQHRIYSHKASAGRPVLAAARAHAMQPRETLPETTRAANPVMSVRTGGVKTELRQQLERLLSERYAPPGLYLDQDLQILSFQGDVSPYLRPSSGRADLHLGKMLPAEVALDIRTAVTAARKTQQPAVREDLRVPVDGRVTSVNLTVIPFGRDEVLVPGYLVLFEPAVSAGAAMHPSKSQSRRERSELARLQKLLRSTRAQLQAVIEEQEHSVQALITAREELMSSNEELQSSNEELEAAKEELLSGNEELTTVNEELRKRNEELDRLTGELGNLISGVNIPIVNLDRERRVVRFSPSAKTAFNLIDTDIGRSFDHINVPLLVPDLDRLIVRALRRGNVIRREVRDKSGRWQLMCIRPYRQTSNDIVGVLIALMDINTVMRRALAIVETIQEPLLILDAKMRVMMVNPAFCRTFRITPAQAEGVSLFNLGGREWDIPALHKLVDEVLPNNTRFKAFRVEREFAELGRKVFLLSGQQVFDEGVGTSTLLIVFEDVTERETTANEMRALTKRLREEKEQVEKRIAHELHDLSSQGFAGLSIDLARLAALVASVPHEVEQGLRSLGERVSSLARDTHELARRLHPSVLDDLGLAKALKAECHAFQQRTTIKVNYQTSALPRKIPDSVALCIYRVVQEALRNVAGHAKAQSVKVSLRGARERITVVVQDDGVGFDSEAARAKGGLGLVSIAERVAAVDGTVSVHSKPGTGTTLKVVTPLHRRAAGKDVPSSH